MKLQQKGGRRKAEGGHCFHRSRCAHHFPLPPSPFPPRRGITLIEVLISMFVLLFGLMGVAAIFPVASHYILEGDKRDRSSGLAQLAFEELKARKILKPRQWVYPTNSSATAQPQPYLFLPNSGQLTDYHALLNNSGMAVVIDPLAVTSHTLTTNTRWFFPANANNGTNPSIWSSLRYPANPVAGINNPVAINYWPVMRVSLDVNPNLLQTRLMDAQTAETAFRLRDDLAVEQPDAGDRPSIQRWQTSGGQLLSRSYVGDYSWLATVVPTSARALMGLQPAANIKDAFYEVTTVVFYKRDIVPSTSAPGSPGSERLIAAEFLNESELAIYDSAANDPAAVDLALDGIKPTNWIAVMGVNQLNGMFMMKWYKVQAMDDTTIQQNLPGAGANRNVRYLMVQGPDWPAARNNAGVDLGWQNLRVAILPGAIDAYTRVMQVDVE